MPLSSKEASQIFSRFSDIKVLVIGDIMFDHYIWGDVHRISPEAPVPVVKVTRESHMPGGAANVVNNLHSLGVPSGITGILGRDTRGTFIRSYFKRKKVDIKGLFSTRQPTIEKIRIIAHSQQVVRVDRENRFNLSKTEKRSFIKRLRQIIPRFDAVILEDYGKGVLDQDIADVVLSIKKRKPALIVSYDPKKGHELSIKNIDLGTPNLSEAEYLIFRQTDRSSVPSPEITGKLLRQKWKAQALLLTRGEKGMTLFEKGKKTFHIPTMAREVYDVSGAGDTVIAAATASLAAGASLEEAAEIANYAAGIVVGKLGTQTVTKKEILNKIRQETKE